MAEKGCGGKIDKLTELRFIRFAYHAIPEMMEFQLLTKVLLAAAVFCFRRLAGVLLAGGGYAAITSSDITALLGKWQGWLLILLLILILFIYTAVEILAQIVHSDNIMRGEKMSIWRTYARGLARMPAFVNAGGIPLILFITFAVPLTGIGYTISLTRSFRIPNFITSEIFSNLWLNVIYLTGIAAAVWYSIRNTYTFPGVVLDGLKLRSAKQRSVQLVRSHKLDLVRRYIPLFALELGLSILIEIMFRIFPAWAVNRMGLAGRAAGAPVIFLGIAGDILLMSVNMLMTSTMLLMVTVLYRSYTKEKIELREEQQEFFRFRPRTPIFAVLGMCLAGAVLMEIFYSDFVQNSNVQIIAHRGGGDLAAENSIRGVEEAVLRGAYGSEIDVQRTKDGHYIVNHDATFSRLCGVSRKPSEMTLEEIRGLTITDSQFGTTYRAKVPTLEEMLDAAEDGVTLFIELKGETADTRMADDIAAILRERKRLDDCVVISLKREIVEYTERHYPEVNTGILYYVGYGAIPSIGCDLLIMEEDLATTAAVREIHNSGKLAVVWTVNTTESMERFLDSEVDAVITDHVADAQEVRSRLNDRSDVEKLVARLEME